MFFYMQRIEAGLLYGALVYCNNCTGVTSLKCFTAWRYQFALIKQAKPHGGEKLCKCVSLLFVSPTYILTVCSALASGIYGTFLPSDF